VVTSVFHVISLGFLWKNWFVHLVYAVHFSLSDFTEIWVIPILFLGVLG
jgi:hypothetical protein